jgi:hypothetical protein
MMIARGRNPTLEALRRPGKDFGPLLAAAYEAQLGGVFHDVPRALEWLGQQHHLEVPEDVCSILLQNAAERFAELALDCQSQRAPSLRLSQRRWSQ